MSAKVVMSRLDSARTRQVARKILVHVGAFISLALVGGVLWVLYHILDEIQLSEVMEAFQSASLAAMVLAVSITIASYFVLTGYDVLALNHINRPLPYPRTALASFLAYAFGNNIGFSLVTGTSIRYRIYTPAGLSATEIAAIAVLCAGTFALGTIVILALGMLVETHDTSETLRLPSGISRTTSIIVLMAATAYLLVTTFRPIIIRTGTWSVRLPSARIALAQLALAALDLTLVATVLYVLLPVPTGTSFLGFLTIFVLGLVAGTASHVPGGIGVFEAVLLLGLPEVPPAMLLGAVLLFRCIYYLLPLGFAAALFAGHELVLHRGRLERVRDTTSDWLAEIGPHVMAILLIFGGVILLFSGAIPVHEDRMAIIESVVPLWVVEPAHLLGTVSGVGLVFLAHSITRRLAAAYRLSAILLALGIVAVLLKGLDYVEALMLTIILVMLLVARPEFQRKGSPFAFGYPVQWSSTLTAILAVTVWIGLFSYKESTYTAELWWSFGYDADFPRFLRGGAGIVVLTIILTLVNWMRKDSLPELPQAAGLEQALRIIRQQPHTRGNLALLGDKRLLFNDLGNAFIMYRMQGRSWIALGDPVGPRTEHEQLIWKFRELCDRYSGRPVFYLVDGEGLSTYVDIGLSVLKLGDDARVPLETFSLDDAKREKLREVHRRIQAHGLGFGMLNSAQVPPLVVELKVISDAWREATGSREKGFSSGVFDPSYVSCFPCALVVEPGGRIVAFATLWASGGKEELALDLMRYRPDAPPGVMDFLLVELMLGGRAKGYRWFNLGIAPLTTLERQSLAPLWHRIGGLIYRQSEHFHDIATLRRYEDQFSPVWRPKYLAAPGGITTPRVLRDIARLIERPNVLPVTRRIA
jgi:phosphatidylglycerol lysyltransferase